MFKVIRVFDEDVNLVAEQMFPVITLLPNEGHNIRIKGMLYAMPVDTVTLDYEDGVITVRVIGRLSDTAPVVLEESIDTCNEGQLKEIINE